MKFLDATLKPVTFKGAFVCMVTALAMLFVIGTIYEMAGGDWRRSLTCLPGIFVGMLAAEAGAGIRAPKALLTIAIVGAAITGLVDLALVGLGAERGN